MAVERDAVHLPRLALVPVGAGVHRTHDSTCGSSSATSVLSTTRWCAPRGRRDHREHLEAARRRRRRRRWSPSAARAVDVSPGALVDEQRRGHPVDRGDEREVVAAELLPCRTARSRATRRGAPGRRRRRGRAVLDDRVAELGLEAREHLRRGGVERGSPSAIGRLGGVGLRVRPRAPASRQPTTIGSRCVARQRSAGSSFWMRSCSITMPWMKASGRGGQPGTYTSTGMIWSTPFVTE